MIHRWYAVFNQGALWICQPGGMMSRWQAHAGDSMICSNIV